MGAHPFGEKFRIRHDYVSCVPKIRGPNRCAVRSWRKFTRMRVGSVTREHASWPSSSSIPETSRSKVSGSKGIYARLAWVAWIWSNYAAASRCDRRRDSSRPWFGRLRANTNWQHKSRHLRSAPAVVLRVIHSNKKKKSHEVSWSSCCALERMTFSSKKVMAHNYPIAANRRLIKQTCHHLMMTLGPSPHNDTEPGG